VGAKSDSASQLGLGKPPSTPEMSAHDVEAMANAMLLDSTLLDPERANEEIPEDAEAAGFQEKEKARSFLKEAMINSLRRTLQVSF
jgi:hypothetical protein